jgi:hypothetical protein
MPQVQICRGYGHKDLEELLARLAKNGAIQPDRTAWRRAIRVFDRRMNERFFSTIKALVSADSRLRPIYIPNSPNAGRVLPPERAAVVPGFAILGLCCLLIETLALFRGLEGNDKEKFIAFLQRPSFGKAFNGTGVAHAFWEGIRCGILHQAETRKWLIRRNSDQMVSKYDELFIVDRTRFLTAVQNGYKSYLRDLRTQQDDQLLKTFVDRMEKVVERVTKLPSDLK